MKVRLGFAVLTQLPHPVMLVDEALAVGDKDFRKKCYKTISEMLAEGRTLVFVSHNEKRPDPLLQAWPVPGRGLSWWWTARWTRPWSAYRGEEVEV